MVMITAQLTVRNIVNQQELDRLVDLINNEAYVSDIQVLPIGIGSDDEIDATGERCDTCGDSLVGDMCASDPQHKVSIDPLGDEHTVYGACGVPDCRDCRPLFDADDNIIAGTE